MSRVLILTDGPIDTKRGPRCSIDGMHCKHFGVHDWHYFYCAARPAVNWIRPDRPQTYPWPGAGKMFSGYPQDGCPKLHARSSEHPTQPKEQQP